MRSHDPPSPISQPGLKRQRLASVDAAAASPLHSPTDRLAESLHAAAGARPGQGSNFRNVSACNRCRLRKNRCDQRLPSCASCAKAGVPCVGYDPITKKETPRSYVFYLETRVEQLEKLLLSHKIPFPSPESLELCSRPATDAAATSAAGYAAVPDAAGDAGHAAPHSQPFESLKPRKAAQSPPMLNVVSKPRSLASASGVSFARVVLAAVQYSVSDQGGPGERSNSRNPSGSGTSMRDSFFGLHTKPTILPAPFPDKSIGLRLVTLYFEHANPQIPILHRGEFMQVFEHAYENAGRDLAARQLYLLNMVFAIGSGVIVGKPVKAEASDDATMALPQARHQHQPEEYHASAIVHLDSCLSFSGGGLEVLQAVLLLANFALLRPVPPGLWYIIGVAVRLAVDLGLHHEEGVDVDDATLGPSSSSSSYATAPSHLGASSRGNGSQERGRRLWVRDLRRRLWWCTYSFDRLVSTCVGRPVGIGDPFITTELPSLLDDDYITPAGFLDPPPGRVRPSYKLVAHHYFRLRVLQSEIIQVLQYNQAKRARAGGAQSRKHQALHPPMSSAFLGSFDCFRTWRIDIDRRLYQWKGSAPTRLETGVAFSTDFLELNYWQAIILLYRQSLSIPAMFEGEYNTLDEVNSPTAYTAELREDQDRIHLKVAEAGQKILRIYRQLHLSGLVSYTYLSTHHLFMAGISYLYAIWHSPVVRSHLTLDEVDFTVLAAKSIFTDMIDKCPPAETCRDAFDRTAKATIKMASSSGGFGPPREPALRPRRDTVSWTSAPNTTTSLTHHPSRHRQQQSDQGPLPLGMSISDKPSSPSQPATGERQTPPSGRLKFDTDAFIAPSQSHGEANPGGGAMGQDARSSIDPLLVSSPSVSRRTAARQLEGSANTFLDQRFEMQGGSMEYPDAQTMECLQSLEFLQSLGTRANGDVNNAEQAQLDLGFGINWEGMHNDYGQVQQMNLFDTFFFGGQQSGGPGGG